MRKRNRTSAIYVGDPICCAHFCSKGVLNTHITSVHEGKNPLSVTDVTFVLYQTYMLNVHDRKKPFKCEVCQANFGQNCELKMHISRAHDNPKLYSCNTCNEEFLKRTLLKNHVFYVHEDKILFSCEICKREFSKKSNLTRHTSKFHKENFQDNKEVKEALEFKTENVQDYIEKPTFVELKGEDISKWELNNPPAMQIKTEILNLQNESAQIDELILGV